MVAGIYAIAAFLSGCELKREIFSRGMQQVLFCWLAFHGRFWLLCTTAADLISSRTQDELHFFL